MPKRARAGSPSSNAARATAAKAAPYRRGSRVAAHELRRWAGHRVGGRRAGCEEDIDDDRMPCPARKIQDGFSVSGRRMDIGAAIHEQLNHVRR
jgi:hypothetical protein